MKEDEEQRRCIKEKRRRRRKKTQPKHKCVCTDYTQGKEKMMRTGGEKKNRKRNQPSDQSMPDPNGALRRTRRYRAFECASPAAAI